MKDYAALRTQRRAARCGRSAFSFGKHETKRFRVVRARKNATDGAKPGVHGGARRTGTFYSLAHVNAAIE
jgi:hypothetical protein